MDDLRSTLTALGFELQQIDHEDACGRYEINYKFDDALASGLHFHLSITDADGRAIFADPSDALGLSAAGHQFAAGLLEHADALSALCAPTVNSYKRLALSHSASGTTWSPVW